MSKIVSLWNVEAVEEALSKIGWNKKRIDEEAEVVSTLDICTDLSIISITNLKSLMFDKKPTRKDRTLLKLLLK